MPVGEVGVGEVEADGEGRLIGLVCELHHGPADLSLGQAERGHAPADPLWTFPSNLGRHRVYLYGQILVPVV